MGNTYSQLTVQAVFAVKRRENLIDAHFRDELFQYVGGTLKAAGAHTLAVGGWKDHLHILFGLPVTGRVSDIVGFVKANSSR